MQTYENQNIQYHQNVSLKKHLRHPEYESQRLDFARLRFVRQSTHVSIHLLKSSLDPVEQQVKHDRHPPLYTNPADVSAGFVQSWGCLYICPIVSLRFLDSLILIWFHFFSHTNLLTLIGHTSATHRPHIGRSWATHRPL